MSDITITEKNLSRFTKRLQKSLSIHLKQDIPLHLAQLIFAESLGVDTIHHLQQKLSQPVEIINECLEIQKLLEGYFKAHYDTHFTSLNIMTDEQSIFFDLNALNKNHDDAEGFSIFFGRDPSYVENELKRLDLTISDLQLVEELISLLHFENLPKSIYLGELLKEHFKLNRHFSFYSFKENIEFEEVTNYGFCEKLYALISEHFFEQDAPYILNKEHFTFIDLKDPNVQFFRSFESAKDFVTEKTILLEFLTPIKQFSRLIFTSKYKEKGISSHYFYLQNTELIASTWNSKQTQSIHKVEDYYQFLGKNNFNMSLNIDTIQAKYATNQLFRGEIIAGFESCFVQTMQNKIKK